jgi:hypothetical protein
MVAIPQPPLPDFSLRHLIAQTISAISVSDCEGLGPETRSIQPRNARNITYCQQLLKDWTQNDDIDNVLREYVRNEERFEDHAAEGLLEPKLPVRAV